MTLFLSASTLISNDRRCSSHPSNSACASCSFPARLPSLLAAEPVELTEIDEARLDM
jgi:hypothetical protein